MNARQAFTRPEIIRPPSEAKSYFLPLTNGCSNNTCIFCRYYGSKLQIRDSQEAKAEIDALALYRSAGLQLPGVPNVVYAIGRSWNGRRVFLQDGDALVYPFHPLTEVLTHLNTKFPDLDRVSAYATPRDVLRRSVQELETLQQLKLQMIYLGVETGDPELLQRIGKRVNYDEMVEAGRRVKAAGIILSVTVLLGLGGVEASEQHVLNTARVLTAIDPDYAGALTLTLVPGTPLHQETLQGTFNPISPIQSLQELRLMVAEANFTDCVFSSQHASNYLSLQGRLPQERDLLLRQLDEVISAHDPSRLRPEYLRGL